jgi:type IV secretory pathway TraG/TraD family ATPase VirD4
MNDALNILMNVLNFWLMVVAPHALPFAIGASFLLLLAPFLYIVARGQAIRRSADGRGRSRWVRLWSVLMIVGVPVAVTLWGGVVGRELLLRRNGILDETWAQRYALLLVLANVMGWLVLWWLVRTGSPLSEFLGLLLGGVKRRRDELGSAHFADLREYKRFADKHPQGMTLLGEFRGEEHKPQQYRILGNRFSLSAEDAARGVITIGNPGSGKSQGIILPIIADSMKDGESLIITDPQGELRHNLLDFARVTGHIVIVHDPTDDNCARFNLADGVQTVSNARALAEVLLPSAQGNDFWQGSARALLAACLIRYESIGQIVERLGNLSQLIADLDSQQDDARFLVSDFIDASRNAPKQAVGVTATIMRALDAWADSTVRASTSESDFDARVAVYAKRPIVILLASPGRDRRALAPYLGAVLTKLLLDLDTIGEKIPGGALPRPLKFILEEFPAMGNLSVIVEQANLVRKRRIAFLIACQTVGQLYNIYGRDGAHTLLAGMATQIVFGGADKETATYFSSLAGNQTRTLESDGKFGTTTRHVERALLTHDQIISPPHAPQGNVILFTRYVTESYAVNAVILARLTRMYERTDWRRAISQAKGRRVRLFTRKVAQKQSAKQQTDDMPASIDDTKREYTAQIIDDGTPAHEQNIVVPWALEKGDTV